MARSQTSVQCICPHLGIYIHVADLLSDMVISTSTQCHDKPLTQELHINELALLDPQSISNTQGRNTKKIMISEKENIEEISNEKGYDERSDRGVLNRQSRTRKEQGEYGRLFELGEYPLRACIFLTNNDDTMNTIKKKALNELADFCTQKYDLFNRNDDRLREIFERHFDKRVQVYKDNYYWTPELEQDYWLHTGLSCMAQLPTEDDVVEFWREIETIWIDHLRDTLRGHNDVPAVMPYYQCHFVSEPHPKTKRRVTVWKSMMQRQTTYLIMNESATTVYHRLNHIRQLDRSDQILCTELNIRTGTEQYWLFRFGECTTTTALDTYYRADKSITASLCSFAILSTPRTRPKRRPLYIDRSRLHIRPEALRVNRSKMNLK